MIPNIISVNDLQFSFGKQIILKNISLQVPENSIFGFLGHNGAGKSTTIRVLLNLLKIDQGKVFLFGKDIVKNRVEILKNIGALIEHPSLYGHLTGRQNLEITRRLLGTTKTRVDEVLEIVKLTKDADKKSKEYSLGMCQRLSLALALLSNPKLLILDEPMNGLDPSGILEMRELIISLKNDHKKTIFLSSHILPEIEKTATHLGIINKGEILFQGKIEELGKYTNSHLKIETDNITKTSKILEDLNYTISDKNGKTLKTEIANKSQVASINKTLVENEIEVFSLSASNENLEDIFLNITK